MTAITQRAAIKWREWIDAATPVPTRDAGGDVPGLYEGARYCFAGLYRPTVDSKMRSLYRPYEQVNVQQLVRRVYNLVAPIDVATPAPGPVTAGPQESVAFHIARLRPANHDLRVNWEVDGRSAGTTDALSVDTAVVGPGDHLVRVTVTDPTPSVRNDPEQALVQSVTWTLRVSQPARPTVTVLTPNGGEVVARDAPLNVQWSASDVDGLAFAVETSVDGVTYVAVQECSALPDTTRNCVINRMGSPSTRARVRVTAHDGRAAVAFDVSDGPFTIADLHTASGVPAPWSADDVGTVGPRGQTTASAGLFQLEAGGSDVWSSADAFHFVHQRLTGDGDIVIRVEQLASPVGAAFAMAGVMFRESLAAGSRHASLVITSGGKAKFRRRLAENGDTRSDGPSAGTTPVPRWLKLARRGHLFTAYLSADGIAWSAVHAGDRITMRDTVEVGFLALRNGNAERATARVDGVSVVPAGWVSSGIGSGGSRRSVAYTDASFIVAAGGVDVWSTSDAFDFVHRRWTGDGDVVVRVEQLTAPGDALFAMAGVMFRETLGARARHASTVITSSGKAKFRRRITTAAITLSDGARDGTTAVPRWLKVSRRGDVFTSYLSVDGRAWTLVHPGETIAMPRTVHVGFFALRKGGNGLAVARVGGVHVLPPGWASAGIGVAASRRAVTHAGASYELTATGRDVWSTADALHFVHRSWTGDGDMVMRVARLATPADASFAMAGVMFRESLAAGSRHAAMVITSQGKAKFRRRLVKDGHTRSDGPRAGALPVPRWVKISRRGNVFTASISTDGVLWTEVHPGETIAMPRTLEVGFFALRQGGTGAATASLTEVSVAAAR